MLEPKPGQNDRANEQFFRNISHLSSAASVLYGNHGNCQWQFSNLQWP
jgi:hypothetical protein